MFKSTDITGVITAIRRHYTLPGTLVLLFQEGSCYTRINMRPGKHFVQGTLAVGIERGFQSVIGKGTEPVFIFELLGPGIKSTAEFPGMVEDFSYSPISPRQGGFKQACLRVVPGKAGTLVVQSLLEYLVFGIKARFTFLGCPLEGGVWLGDEG